MGSRSERFYFELARPEDGLELLEILETQSFEGQIGLLYTRRPDAYASFQMEGNPVDVVVCRDRQEGRIAGLGTCAHQRLYVNGTPQPVGYLAGLRGRPEYLRKAPVLHRGYASLRQLQQQEPAFYLTSILEENIYAQRLLEKRRSFMPVYESLTAYKLFAITTARATERLQPGVRRATLADLPRLMDFLQREGARQQFFPAVAEESLGHPPFTGLSAQDFLIWEEDGELLAAAGLWDQRHYKQYMVQGYAGLLRLLRPLSFLFPLLGWPALPPAGSTLHFFTLSLWAVRGGDAGLFAPFLDQVRVAGRDYPFFLVGLPVVHPLSAVLEGRRHIGYRSRIYLVYWPEQEAAVRALLRDRPLYLECGLL